MAKAVFVPPVPAKPEVVLTLTWEEAVSLRRMVGAIGTTQGSVSLQFSGYVGSVEAVRADRAVVDTIYNALTGVPGLHSA